jgi:hypothetical protein
MTDKDLEQQLEGIFSQLDEPVAGPLGPEWAEMRWPSAGAPSTSSPSTSSGGGLGAGWPATSSGGGLGAGWPATGSGREPAGWPATSLGGGQIGSGLTPSGEPVLAPGRPVEMNEASRVNWRLMIWAVIGSVVAVVMVYAYGQAFFGRPGGEPDLSAGTAPGLPLPPGPSPSATATASPTATSDGFAFVEATSTPTPPAGGSVVVVRAVAADSGWVVSKALAEAERLNHLGDPLLFAGSWAGRRYYAAFQFDLGEIPRGTRIVAASLRLTGARADQLAPDGSGAWRLQLLPSELDYHWRAVDYRQLARAEPWSSFEPALGQADLAAAQDNVFEFSDEQLRLLERRLLAGSPAYGQKVSFRLDGPAGATDNLFAWEGGSQGEAETTGPTLFLSLGPAPLETPPPYYVMITSTPTPETVLTAEVLSVQMTAQAKLVGTVTPLPPYWATPVVVTATPQPGNAATAQAMSREATAVARTTGEPLNQATATSTPTFVIITSTPTPLNVATAAAQAALVGIPPTFPANWVTPLVVTSTPAPENTATAQVIRAILLTTGTPTPLPANVQTATPTPPALAASLVASPTTTPTPSPTPQPLPAVLLGKILFLSDREGATEEERAKAGLTGQLPAVEPVAYAYDPASNRLERLTAMWPYQVAADREAWSADERYETYNQRLLWTHVDNKATEVYAIHYYDYEYNVETQVTNFGAGNAWDPVWSPVSDRLALVANESSDDEIWVVNRDGSDPRRLTETNEIYNAQQIGKDTFIPELNGHPSWSPDGSQIVFWSNRSGARQIWLMNADGSNQRLLMAGNPYNDWDPIWVKYQDPAPPQARQPDWRFVK